MNMLARLFGRSRGDMPIQEPTELEIRREAVEAELRHERGRLHQSVQNIQSGSRVMQNMAGMMSLMSMAGRTDNEHH